jgi:hypothetical protein
MLSNCFGYLLCLMLTSKRSKLCFCCLSSPAAGSQVKLALFDHPVEQPCPEHACRVVLLAEGQQLVKLGVQRRDGAARVREGAVKVLALQVLGGKDRCSMF